MNPSMTITLSFPLVEGQSEIYTLQMTDLIVGTNKELQDLTSILTV